MIYTGICKHCGHDIRMFSSDVQHAWVHTDGIALCPTATYASPELA